MQIQTLGHCGVWDTGCGVGHFMTVVCLSSPSWSWKTARMCSASGVGMYQGQCVVLLCTPYAKSAHFLTSAAPMGTTLLEFGCLNVRAFRGSELVSCPVPLLRVFLPQNALTEFIVPGNTEDQSSKGLIQDPEEFREPSHG